MPKGTMWGAFKSIKPTGKSWLALLTTLANLAIGHSHTIQKKCLTVPELHTANEPAFPLGGK